MPSTSAMMATTAKRMRLNFHSGDTLPAIRVAVQQKSTTERVRYHTPYRGSARVALCPQRHSNVKRSLAGFSFSKKFTIRFLRFLEFRQGFYGTHIVCFLPFWAAAAAAAAAAALAGERPQCDPVPCTHGRLVAGPWASGS